MDIFDVFTSAAEVSKAADAAAGLAAGICATGGIEAAVGVGVAVAAAGTTCEGGFFCGLMLPTVR